jgi:ECF transporter S component (folate family)
MMNKNRLFAFSYSIHSITLLAMFIASHVILTRFLSIPISTSIRISFGFFPIALTGLLLGPISAMVVGGIGDLLGALFFPIGPFYFGFTLTAILSGLIYGSCLFRKTPVRLYHVILSKLIADLLLNIGLNSLWIHHLYGQAMMAILPARALKNLVQFPIDAALLYSVIILITHVPDRYLKKLK